MLPHPSLVHEFFSVWARLMSSFQHHVACLERQLWFRACILYFDPITCHYVIPLLVAVVVWLHPLETPQQMCRITFNILTSSKISTVFMMRNTLLALDNFYYHRQHPWLPFIASLSTLWIQPALQLMLCSALKYYRLYVRIFMGIAPALVNSWRSDTSRHHYSFLGSELSQQECRQVYCDVWNQYS